MSLDAAAVAHSGPEIVPPATVSFTLNGTPHALEIEPRAVLLDVLRENIGLTGTKKGCDHGQCGACTVLVNGRRVLSCLSLAVMHDGDDITTIEGLENEGELHPMQAAFLTCDAFQCGYCTSGQIMSAIGLCHEPPFDVTGVTQTGASGPADQTASPANGRSEPKTDLSKSVTRITHFRTVDDAIREGLSGNICRCGAYKNILAAVKEAMPASQAARQTGNPPHPVGGAPSL